jgi:DNA-binding GntR family transcriptional regulator
MAGNDKYGEVSKKLHAYKIIKERIVQNELKPQEYLNEQRLSEELGISKTPVREAIQQLQRDRHVVVIPSKGCLVASISLDLIREVFQIREIFECAAARLAAGMPSRDQFKEILANHDSFKLRDEQGVRTLLLSGYQIHDEIVRAAGNSFLTEYYGSVLDHILRIRIFFLSRFDSSRLNETCEEHKAILRAIIDGNADEAEQAMRFHLNRSLISIDHVMLSNRRVP